MRISRASTAVFSLTMFAAVIGSCKHAGASNLESGQPKKNGTQVVYQLSELMSRPVKKGRYQFLPVPLIRQARNYTCGPASMQSVLAFWNVRPNGGDHLTEGQLAAAENLNSNPDTGTKSSDMVKLIEKLNTEEGFASAFTASPVDETKVDLTGADRPRPTAKFKYSYDLFDGVTKKFDVPSLKKELDNGFPVIVDLQAWSGDKSKKSWKKEMDAGHYIVAMGYEDDGAGHDAFFFMDPWTTGNYTYIPGTLFRSRWHDTDDNMRNDNFALIIRKEIFSSSSGDGTSKYSDTFNLQDVVPLK